MAQERLDMRNVYEIFRLHFEQKKSGRAIAISTGRGRSTIQDYLTRASKAGLTEWSQIMALSETELEERLGFKQPAVFGGPRVPLRKPNLVMPDWQLVHQEMSKRHVTVSLLWNEYCEVHGKDAYGYTQYREHYNRWLGKLSVVMRQSHNAGEKTFIDYSGDGLILVDPATGTKQKVELFVAALGASSYTYAEATMSQALPDWIGSHTRMAAYFGGVTEIWVPDNLKSAVTAVNRYEPSINETYRECAAHYGTCVIPARPYRPRDKAKAEVAVLVAQRWILARLRNRLFTSLQEMNEAIHECLEILNNRKMRHLNKSRFEMFEEIDRPALKGLPASPYVLAEWKKVKVNIDYHIAFDHHHYSAPYQLVQELCEVRATATVIEIFYRGARVASHRRSCRRGGYTTLKEHMPKGHREQLEWTPDRIISWSAKIGPQTATLVEKIMASKAHPQQGFGAALGIIRLEKKFGKERVERASARALELSVHSYKFVAQMLKNKMDGAHYGYDESPMSPETDPKTNEVQLALLGAENIRGGGYYH